MSLFVFKDNYLKFFDTKYFVDNAPQQTLGSYGEKAGGFLRTGKLEPKDHLPIPRMKGKIKVIGPIALDAQTSKKVDFSAAVAASLKVVGFSGSVGATYDALANKRLKLVQLFLEQNDVKDWANAAPKALDNLRSYGGDARIVSTLFVIMEASFATSFVGGATFGASVDAAGIVNIKASCGASVSGKNTLSLAPGTVLAYGMLKLDWGKGKDRIDDTDVDEVGMK